MKEREREREGREGGRGSERGEQGSGRERGRIGEKERGRRKERRRVFHSFLYINSRILFSTVLNRMKLETHCPILFSLLTLILVYMYSLSQSWME